MTLYIENPIIFTEPGAISLDSRWHPTLPHLAVASYSQERGGFVTIFDEFGVPLKDAVSPSHRSYQTTAMQWHPERPILATGWENGDLKLWTGGERDAHDVVGPHRAPITLLAFSEKGGKLVSCDASGSLVGWKVDAHGQAVLTFHVELEEPVTHLTFRITIVPDTDSVTVENLARAAVNGDERALDLFSNWRPKTTARKYALRSGGGDNPNFYVGTQTGSIYYVNATGQCVRVLNTEGVALAYVVHHPTKEALVVMMEGLTIGYFRLDSYGHLEELMKVKLSGRGPNSRNIGGMTWCGPDSLAILAGDLVVRVWDLETNDNYILPTTMMIYDNERKTNVSQVFTCLAYCRLNRTLCAGTNTGRIYFWTKTEEKNNIEESWELNNSNTVGGTIKQLMWGACQLRVPLLSVNCVTSVYLMQEQAIVCCYGGAIWAVQKTSNQILVEDDEGHDFLLQIDTHITDMSMDEKNLIISNGKTITVYSIEYKFENDSKTLNLKGFHSFNCENDRILLNENTMIILNPKIVTLKNLNGTTIHTVSTQSNEGEPIGIDLTANFLTIFTIEGYLKIYELNNNQIKPHFQSKNLDDMCQNFGEIIRAKSNCNGNKVAMTLAGPDLVPDGKLYVWNTENDNVLIYDFRNSTSQDDNFHDICQNRIPIDFFWDNTDSRLLVCNARRPHKVINPSKMQDAENVVLTIFISPDDNLKIHDVKIVDPDARLIALGIPFMAILQKLAVVRETMADFNGLEKCNKTTKEAIIDFSYNLSLGNMDAAFKAIKLVQNSTVWESLAKMCVKTRRLDVASVCLGHMGNARAAMALRMACADQTLPTEAKLAVLAVHLGLLDEAEVLYRECGRYDLLNRLLRSRNRWTDARRLAETKDRIHLKNTDWLWAKSLEQSGDYTNAAVHYEKANTHRFDVPRMLADQIPQLENYIEKNKDPELMRWWGQYLESQGEMKMALQVYANAGDIYSQVRVLCYLGEELKAGELAKANTDKAAFYHMARHYETLNRYEEAVSFFTKAHAYSNAVRLCKENEMREELWNIAQVAGNREKYECARYFDECNDMEKATLLYHRSGMLHKALDLAFKSHNFDILRDIAADLDSNSDPALVEKCTNYFIANEQYDKAVDLLAISKKFQEAIEICSKYNVTLTEDLCEKLTPEKGQIDENLRTEILLNLAENLTLQGDYHLATKKFTQAGDRLRAMKALLKSGDTDKITFFATVSRQREIYIMAANYLQSLDWQKSPDILKNIINFYSKGKALDLLANFYVACAQVEIDEFQSYEKALGALNEAQRCLAKITNKPNDVQYRRASEVVRMRMENIQQFVDVRRMFEKGDMKNGLEQCKALLSQGPSLESSVRRGDIYALMIQECVRTKDFREAQQYFSELKQILVDEGNTPLTYYLNKEVIENLAEGLGIHITSLVPMVKKSVKEEEINEFVEEVLDD